MTMTVSASGFRSFAFFLHRPRLMNWIMHWTFVDIFRVQSTCGLAVNGTQKPQLLKWSHSVSLYWDTIWSTGPLYRVPCIDSQYMS